MIRKICGKTFILACGFLAASCVFAQTDIEVNAGLELNLSQPGARSLGMGGAFIGLADDATAAYTNPAGLANITVSELALEARAWDYKTKFTDSGFAIFEDGGMDDSRVIDGEISTSRQGVSFGSYVLPGTNWTGALYFHQLANYEAQISTHGANDLRPITGNTELEIQTLGGAFAYRFGPSFSLGFSVGSSHLVWNSRVRRFRLENSDDPDFWHNEQTLTADEAGFTGSAGFQWRVAEHVHLGGVYRLGPEFDIATTSIFGPASDFDGIVINEASGTAKFPDSYGLGLAITSTSFRFLVDWVRVEYSNLTKTMISTTTNLPQDIASVAHLMAKDANELHAGFEFVISQLANPVAIRVGGFFDPDHKLRFSGPITNDVDEVNALIFRPGEDQIHYSAGMGINFRDGKFELNVAADVADRVNTLSFSFVTRPF